MPPHYKDTTFPKNVVYLAYNIRKVLYYRGQVGSDEIERCYNMISNFQVAFSRSLN
jgi:hypothetical protein